MSYRPVRKTGRTRRRRPPPKIKFPRSYNPTSTKGLKAMNTQRAKVGLPRVEIKKRIIYHNQAQYATKTSTVWSFSEDLMRVAVGTDNITRESNKLRFLPSKFRFRLQQPIDENRSYRFLVFKSFDKYFGVPDPNEILANATTPAGYFCTYKIRDDTAAGDPRFKVLQDKSFTWSTYGGNPNSKWVKFKIPGANVEYDDDDTTGTLKKNAIYVVGWCEGPASSATHTLDTQFYMKYLDQ